MKAIYNLTIFLISIMTVHTNCKGQTQRDTSERKIVQDLQRSYLDANLPSKSQFDGILKRDLEKYFSGKSGRASVKWEFLRDGPTQSGVSYPKYYLWTKIYLNEKLINEGAVRVAAIERTRFDITDFVDVNEIKSKSKDIYTIFPGSVCEKIGSYLQNR